MHPGGNRGFWRRKSLNYLTWSWHRAWSWVQNSEYLQCHLQLWNQVSASGDRWQFCSTDLLLSHNSADASIPANWIPSHCCCSGLLVCSAHTHSTAQNGQRCLTGLCMCVCMCAFQTDEPWEGGGGQEKRSDGVSIKWCYANKTCPSHPGILRSEVNM